jgi:hypothetical protein
VFDAWSKKRPKRYYGYSPETRRDDYGHGADMIRDISSKNIPANDLLKGAIAEPVSINCTKALRQNTVEAEQEMSKQAPFSLGHHSKLTRPSRGHILYAHGVSLQ